MACGRIENQLGTTVVFAEGVQQSGGEVVNGAGRIEAVGTYALTGGTVDLSGSLDGISLLADQIDQTGGVLTAYGAMIDVNGTYNQVAGVVELDTSSAIVDGGWVVGQSAALYAFRTNSITGNLTNGGLLELGPMTSPSYQPWNDTLAINGDFGQSATGNLTLDVGNSNTDTVHVSNHAGFGGGLTVRAPTSFSGFPGQTINLIFYQTRSGGFGSVSLQSGNWIPEYIDNPPDGPGWFRIRKPYMFP